MASVLRPYTTVEDSDQITITKKIKINYEPHTGQALFHASNARFRIVCCGRKWGKTTMLVMEAFKWLGRPDTLVWWVAPYHQVAQLGHRRFIEAVPPVVISGQDRREGRVNIINGSQIWFKSGDNPDGLVGEGIDLLILDEAARVKQDVWEQTLYPNLDDPRRLGHMAAASTPKGHNWFYSEWLKGVYGQDNRESWGQPLKELPLTRQPVQDVTGGWPSWNNPHFPVQRLEEALGLPELVFMQEYAARFLSDLGAVFQNIRGAVKGQLANPVEGENYYMGVDLGKVNDYTVITIINSEGHVDYWNRFKSISWPSQANAIVRAARIYNEATMLIDSTGLGDPVFDFIKLRYPHIQAFKLTNKSKRELIENLSILISTEKFTYPEIPELMEELQMFGASQSRAGNIKYEAPSGFHDDAVISAGLAAWLKFRAVKRKLSFVYYDW